MTSRNIPWRPVIIWGVVGALLTAAFIVVVFRGTVFTMAGEDTPAPTPPASATPSPTPTPTPAGPIASASEAAPGTLPDRATLEQRINSLDVAALTKGVQDGGSLTLAYQVLDVESGEVLAASNADQPLVPASNTKLLTLTSLLSVFDGTETFDTTVVSPAPGQLVLVGDPLLASAASDAYPKRASLEELAARTAQKLKSQGVEKVTLGYDASLFQESWATTWPSSYRDQVTPISALWADEGMDASQARSTDPAGDAARIFASQLTAQAAAVQEELTSLGLWHEGAVLHDGSGLTRENHVTASMLAGVVRYVLTTPKSSIVQEGFPIAGVSGSLAKRFEDEASAPGRGVVRAKTGTLSLVSTLAGTTVTADGREVAMAFMMNGSTDGWAAQVWSDQAASLVTGCGC